MSVNIDILCSGDIYWRLAAIMKIYFTFVIALMIGSVFLELHLIEVYKPSLAVLQHTSLNKGKLYFVSDGHLSTRTAKINGMQFGCGMDFFSGTDDCLSRFPSLVSGSDITLRVVYIPALTNIISLATSIAIDGKEIYSVSPETVQAEYLQSSRRGLKKFPLIILFFSIILPLPYVVLVNISFRNKMLSIFSKSSDGL